VRRATENGEKVEPVFMVEIKDQSGEVVAIVERTLYVKKK
jgi:hypothetical protein